ncbi:head-tail adaptor protein [Rhodovulum sulfidophilum]|uniref:head-tail adaptor protein n=1 Tax=Rhodovulum sulfidophilum TaxID=35806 RepID=UPI001924DD66|nr:head-tail adaptor protein [Rhodovulum sulfidophilum]MBL3572640.1 head-tail adaptor protein [Rhodovulum sulfidophilum]MCE8432987.1 head-tail adaptor protein [Rhodovulum sulfidophilum]MCF4117250.1 head-tail adaptor protein [Rhodovulum sulfidophilum]
MSRVPILNRQLVLEVPVPVADGAGGFSETWAARGTLWAEMSPRMAGERAGEELALSRVLYRVVVRGVPPGAPSRPAAGQRFREGTRYFHIRAVTEHDARGLYLACYAEEEIGV